MKRNTNNRTATDRTPPARRGRSVMFKWIERWAAEQVEAHQRRATAVLRIEMIAGRNHAVAALWLARALTIGSVGGTVEGWLATFERLLIEGSVRPVAPAKPADAYEVCEVYWHSGEPDGGPYHVPECPGCRWRQRHGQAHPPAPACIAPLHFERDDKSTMCGVASFRVRRTRTTRRWEVEPAHRRCCSCAAQMVAPKGAASSIRIPSDGIPLENPAAHAAAAHLRAGKGTMCGLFGDGDVENIVDDEGSVTCFRCGIAIDARRAAKGTAS